MKIALKINIIVSLLCTIAVVLILCVFGNIFTVKKISTTIIFGFPCIIIIYFIVFWFFNKKGDDSFLDKRSILFTNQNTKKTRFAIVVAFTFLAFGFGSIATAHIDGYAKLLEYDGFLLLINVSVFSYVFCTAISFGISLLFGEFTALLYIIVGKKWLLITSIIFIFIFIKSYLFFILLLIGGKGV